MLKLLASLFKKQPKPIPPMAPASAPAAPEVIPVVKVTEPVKRIVPEMPNFGIELVKAFEGIKLEAYQDIVGVWTIGYGITGPEIKSGLKWTEDQANQELLKVYQKFVVIVNKTCEGRLTLNGFQKQALTSFTYNVGERNLLNLVRNRTPEQISNAILLYDKAGGKAVRGLTIRRHVEKDLFNLHETSMVFDIKGKMEQYRREIV